MPDGGDGADGKQKRGALKTYDTAAHQMFNPMGESAIARVKLDILWDVLCKGNKAVEYFTELCSDDPKRQQVAVSKLAEVLTLAMATLEKDTYKKHIEKKLYEGAMKEVKDLKDLLPILICRDSVGQDQTDDTMTVGKLNYQMSATVGETKDEEKVKAAAEKLYAWLTKEKSDLRSLLSFLSGGGLFYAAQCHEKATRAYIQHKEGKRKVSEKTFVDMNVKRLCSGPTTDTKSENPDLPL